MADKSEELGMICISGKDMIKLMAKNAIDVASALPGMEGVYVAPILAKYESQMLQCLLPNVKSEQIKEVLDEYDEEIKQELVEDLAGLMEALGGREDENEESQELEEET